MSKDKKAKATNGQAKAKIPDVLQNAVLARLHDEEGMMAVPTLYECMVPQFEDGKLTRPAGKLSITVEGPYWRVQLDMPYERLTCRLFVPALSSALNDLNAYLASGKAIFAPMYEKSKKPLPRLDAQIQ